MITVPICPTTQLRTVEETVKIGPPISRDGNQPHDAMFNILCYTGPVDGLRSSSGFDALTTE